MAQFIALSERAEVSGHTILSFLACLGSHREKAVKILTNHGIVSIESGKWYSQQAWLDSFKEYAGTLHSNSLAYLGRKIPENSAFPSEINEIGLALQSIDWAYHLNHRLNGMVMLNRATGEMREGIGHYYFEQTSPDRAIIICNDPYPCDYDRGIIDAIAFRFRPAGSTPRVMHEGSGPCRNKGDDFCTYIIEW